MTNYIYIGLDSFISLIIIFNPHQNLSKEAITMIFGYSFYGVRD